MPRQNKAASKIAFKILGKPPVLDFKRSKAQAEVDRQLTYQETARVR